VLVTHDLLGLFDRFTPRFVKKYVDLHGEIAHALSAFRAEVETHAFPAPEHTVEMPDEEWETLLKEMGD
jgi:3-methyl-2-oxobutanoate hydroxymethyltransferase